MEGLWQVLGYGVLCGVALIIGTVISTYWTPSPKFRSYIQHVAAGLVFAAVGVEILPDMLERAIPLAAALGFAAGVGFVLGIEAVAEKFTERNKEKGKESNVSLIGVLTTDIFIDGVLIGVAASAGGEGGSQALLVTIALATELLALGLSMGCTLSQSGGSRTRVITTGGVMGIAPVVGALLGAVLGASLSGFWVEGILAFAAAALMYLATEELLKEAHEVKETPVATLLFFGSFLAILLIDMVS